MATLPESGVNPYDPSTPTDADWVKHAAAEIRALKGALAKNWTPILVEDLEYTVEPEDLGQIIVMRNGGIITIPADLPAGLFGITGLQNTSVVGDTGVTLHVPPTLSASLYEDMAFAVCMRLSSDEWLLSGNLLFAPASSETIDRMASPVAQLISVVENHTTSLADHEGRITALEDEEETT